MGKIRPTQLALIFLAVILIAAAMQSYRIKTSEDTIGEKVQLYDSVANQLNISKKQSKDIAEYILDNDIDMEYLSIKQDNNGYKTIEIYTTNSECKIIIVDDNYNILEN